MQNSQLQRLKIEALHKIVKRFTKTKLLERFASLKEEYGSVNPIIRAGKIIFVTEWREGKIAKNELLAMEEIHTIFPPPYIEKHWPEIVELCLDFDAYLQQQKDSTDLKRDKE